MILRVVRYGVLACALSSCTDGKTTLRSDEPRVDESGVDKSAKGDPVPPKPEPAKRTYPADTPSPTSCTTHDECMVVVQAPGDDPCCDVTVTIGPRTRKFVEFVAGYRASHCKDVECPPLSRPGAQPASCGTVPRCIEGQCSIACNEPTFDAKVVPRLPNPCVATCIERRQMQAISAEAIEKNCQADCAAGTFEP